jgi:hypothetical protein
MQKSLQNINGIGIYTVCSVGIGSFGINNTFFRVSVAEMLRCSDLIFLATVTAASVILS